ncbi:Pyridoxine 5'-phosphate synthase [hydrothermal vent metagenome]|uniref:Pyridoxine 5'-phosphate synthase n=1 Tax=hydrothermal vent metagenome TaxID=652676 RepID=A0A1W1EI90_9ZZZZ
MKLGVNIDHIAVLREARQVNDPDIIDALSIVKLAGANQITIHLREDRRHIQDEDLKRIMNLSSLPINLECAKVEEMIDIAVASNPHRVTIVPENREEVTTEGGLIVDENDEVLIKAINKLQFKGIEVSLFIDPCVEAINSSLALGVEWIELHTGEYANVYGMLYGNLKSSNHSIKRLELPRKDLEIKLRYELAKLVEISKYAKELGLKVAAGHGLNYQNISDIALIEDIEELNIGQSIIARSIFTGLHQAIIDMKANLK